MIGKTAIAATTSTVLFMAFIDFLSQTTPVPIGVLLALAVLPTAEASRASGELFRAAQRRVEPAQPADGGN